MNPSLAFAALVVCAGGCGHPSSEQAPDGGAGPDRPATSDGGSAAAGDDACPLPDGAPARQAFFTRAPADGDLAIEDELVHLIDGAVPGGEIRAAFAYLDSARIAGAFVDAAARGVDTRVILDERNQIEIGSHWTWNSAVEYLQHGLGEGLVICGGADLPTDGQGGCIGSEKQHGAFLAISSTCDRAENVVAQTSAYPTKAQLMQRNDLVVIRGDAGLFAAYRGYWDDLKRQRRDDSYYRVVDGDAQTRLFLYPRAPDGNGGEPAATDTVFRLLHDNVDCSAKTSVKIAMAYWTSSRPALIDELVRLDGAGCAVDLVVDPDKIADDVAAALEDALPPQRVHFLPGVHHKMILVDGLYAGDERRLVWTGTQDFTLPALRDNDETILRIDDDAIYEQYAGAFASLVSDSAAEEPPPP